MKGKWSSILSQILRFVFTLYGALMIGCASVLVSDYVFHVNQWTQDICISGKAKNTEKVGTRKAINEQHLANRLPYSLRVSLRLWGFIISPLI